MRFAQTITAASALWVAVLGLGCQTYDFEPVTPLAIAQKTDPRKVVAVGRKPNLMLLVDRSGSMNLPITPGGACTPSNCGLNSPNGNPFCPSGCTTRWTALQSAMDQFLGAPAPVARMGLTIFPAATTGATTQEQCSASNRMRIDIPDSDDVISELKATADQINNALKAIQGSNGASESPIGGTPIGSSLQWVGKSSNVPKLHQADRDNFVLLLTDGAPNCNAQHPANDLASCRCTLVSCAQGSGVNKVGCLDDAGSTASVQALRQLGIRTIVVGFGADTASGDAYNALNDMASAGGFARSCPNGTNAECGTGNTCLPNNECQIKYYAAQNATELATALSEIATGITKEPCDFKLDTAPSDSEFVSVFLNGDRIPAGPDTWIYDPNLQAIHFPETGTVCPKLKAATAQAPANLEFRVVQTL